MVKIKIIAGVALVSLIFILYGCSIPIKMQVTNRTDPYELNFRLEYEKQKELRDRVERKRIAGYNRMLRLRDARLKKKELLRLPKSEKDIILQSFNDSGIILKAFDKLGFSMFDMAGFLNEYGKSDIDGFCDFLAEKYPFNTWARWALDKEVFDLAKRNYKLLNRILDK